MDSAHEYPPSGISATTTPTDEKALNHADAGLHNLGYLTPTTDRNDSEGYEDVAEDLWDENRAPQLTEEDSARVRRKLDMILMPLFTTLYTFQFLDKQTYNFSSIWGLLEDLHLNATQYAWGGSIFYCGFLVSQFLVGRLAQRFPIAKFTGVSILSWSVILMCLAATKNAAGMFADRFFLGVAEAAISPTCVLMTGMWYTKAEQPLRSSIWFTGDAIGNFIGGLIGYGIGHIEHPALPVWKIFFLIFGGVTVFFAIVFTVLIPDSPMNARWLTADEKLIALERIRSNMTGFQSVKWKWPQVMEAIKDPQVLLLVIIGLCNALPASGPGQFGSIIVKSFGFSSLNTTLLNSLPSAVIQVLSLILAGWLASTRPNLRLWIMSLCNIPPLVGAILLFTLPIHNKAGGLIGYWLCYCHTCTLSLLFAVTQANIAGFTKKATVTAFLFIAYSVGQIAGPQFFILKDHGRYALGFGMMMTCYALTVIFPIILRLYYVNENKRRDAMLSARTGGRISEVDVKMAAEKYRFKDKSDRQNALYFRYVL